MTDEDDVLFGKSLNYVDGLHNKLFGRRFGRDDFEQLNAFYSSSGLEKT